MPVGSWIWRKLGLAPVRAALKSSTGMETSESLNQRLYCRTPMLKPGNGAYRQDDRGIRIGQRLIPGCLIQPNSHFKRLSNRLSKALKRQEELLFTIVEELQP